MLHVLVQVFQLEAQHLAAVEGAYLELLKVADHHQVGQLVLGDVVQVVHGLVVGLGQIFAQGLVFHQQLARPEQIHKAGGTAELFDVVLETEHPLVGDAKDFEKGDPKRRGLAFFVVRIRPGLAEMQGPGLDFTPLNAHKVLF